MYYNFVYLKIPKRIEPRLQKGACGRHRTHRPRVIKNMKRKAAKLLAVLAALILLTASLSPAVYALDMFSSFSELMGGRFGDILTELLGGGQIGGGNNNGTAITLGDLMNNADSNLLLTYLSQRLAALGVDATNSEIAMAIAGLVNGDLSMDLSSLINTNDFINTLAQYLLENPPTTEPPTTQPPVTQQPETQPTQPTEPPTTQPPVTTPTLPPDYSYTLPTVVMPTADYSYQGAQTFPQATETEPVTEPSYAYVEPQVSYADELTTTPFAPVYQDELGTRANSQALKLGLGAAILVMAAGAIVAVAIMLKKTKA